MLRPWSILAPLNRNCNGQSMKWCVAPVALNSSVSVQYVLTIFKLHGSVSCCQHRHSEFGLLVHASYLCVAKVRRSDLTRHALQFHEMARVVDTTQRPLLQSNLHALSHPCDETLGGTFHMPLPPISMSELIKGAGHFGALEQQACNRLVSLYTAVLAMESLQIFENIGDTYMFIDSFSASTYMGANPDVADLLTDMEVMRNWWGSLSKMLPMIHHELMCFDLDKLRSEALDAATKALRAFTELLRDTLKTNCSTMQVRSSSADWQRTSSPTQPAKLT